MSAAKLLATLVSLVVLAPALGAGIGLAVASSPLPLHLPHAATVASPAVGAPFAVVSNFEDHTLGNWTATAGNASVVSSPSYLGEPALSSTGTGAAPQIDHATSGFSTGDPSLSFQAEVYDAASTHPSGFVGLLGPHGAVAVVGISGGSVWAGPSPQNLSKVAAIPTGTAQPSGWVQLLAFVSSTTGPGGTTWWMDVYVDETDVVAANVTVPNVANYLGAILETTGGTVLYTDLIFSTYQIPTTIPGYNNMDGYGQGSGLLVGLLPRFTSLTADVTLENWSIPQTGILSFQFNAMNTVGTTQNTCLGFFQLGVDLDPHGHLAPWYVPNGNCVAYYFNSHDTPKVSSGFVSPAGTHLSLRITDDRALRLIHFTIVDYNVTGANRTVSVTIPYNGTLFEGAYTQVEWQPCCSHAPISSYFFNGTMSGLTISGGSLSAPLPLPASYMIPFALDVPPSWNYGFYDVPNSGYAQVA